MQNTTPLWMSITWLLNKNNNLIFDITAHNYLSINIFYLAWNFLCVLFFMAIYFSVLYFILIILYYYMANPCALIGSFSVRIFQRTVSMETVQSVYFWSEAGKFRICDQNSKRKSEHCHSSHWNYQKKLKRFKFFQNFKDGWRSRTFKCKPPGVHFTIRNRVPYNKQLTNRACSDRTGEYSAERAKRGPYRHDLRTATRSVSKRLIFP